MNTFSSVRRFFVPKRVCDETDRLLRNAGLSQNEHFVLWSGSFDDKNFQVKTLHNPRQEAFSTSQGLCVHVGGDELYQLNRWLHENEERLAIQVHSHPTKAYHSDTDDSYAMVTTLGGLSLVVPNFCNDGVRGPGTALYRLFPSGWRQVSPSNSECVLQLAA